jgi:hypothetical protein
MLEGIAGRESMRVVAGVDPTENEIAIIAYQLWRDNGCPIGSDREDWFRAEAMLQKARIAKCDALSRRLPISCRETRTESEMLVAFRLGVRGHWEVWEMEWGGARWIWDDATPRRAASNRAG